MTLAEIMAEIERLQESERVLHEQLQSAQEATKAFIQEKLGVDPSGPVSIGAVVRLVEKVVESRGVK